MTVYTLNTCSQCPKLYLGSGKWLVAAIYFQGTLLKPPADWRVTEAFVWPKNQIISGWWI